MKNKLLLSVLFVCALCSVHAQAIYNFSKLSSTYTEQTGLTNIHNNSPWTEDGLSEGWNYTLPFNFNINGVNYKFVAFQGAQLRLFSMNMDEIILSSTGIYVADKSVSGATTSISPIGYKVEGAVGSRIFKFQLKNAGSSVEKYFYNLNNMYLNVQVWLYEGTNVIEYHIGPNNINNYSYEAEEKRYFGLVDASSESFICTLATDAQNPTYTELTDLDLISATNSGFSNYPLANTVYRFTPVGNASMGDVFFQKVKVFPNPTSDLLKFEGLIETKNYAIFDGKGALVKKGIISDDQNAIDVSNLPQATYILKVDDASFKFIKQ